MSPTAGRFLGKESYSERSRAYRRSVYFHENWIKHRSNDRYLRNLLQRDTFLQL